MNSSAPALRLFIVASLSLASAAFNDSLCHAESTVTLEGVHICCKGCAGAIEKAVAKTGDDEKHSVEVKCDVNADEGQVTLVGADAEAVQQAVDQIAAAGFYGKLSGPAVKEKKVKFAALELPKEKVEQLEVDRVHNCCPACAKAIKAALAKVEGVESDTCKPKVESFTVKGLFDANAAIAALNKAGFSASLPEDK